jgi:hypothetical protein
MEVVMKDLPERPHFGHLKKQAKELLGACRQHDGAALDRVRAALHAWPDAMTARLSRWACS